MTSTEAEERDRNAVAIDYETFYDTKSGYSLTDMSPQNYCADERFDPYLVSLCGFNLWPEDDLTLTTRTVRFDDGRTVEVPMCDNYYEGRYGALPDGRQTYVGRINDFYYWRNLSGRIFVAHNAGFDSVVFAECAKPGSHYNSASVTDVEWHCTADLTAYLGVQRSLKSAMKYLFGKEISKDVRTAMDGKHFYNLGELEIMAVLEYGCSDAIECHDIWLEYSSQWPDVERKISAQNRDAIARGVLVDRKYAEDSLKELKSYQAQVVCDIPWCTQINPKTREFYKVGSLPALRQAVLDLGISDLPKSFKKDDPGFLSWLECHDDIPFIRARQKAVAISMHSSRIEGILGSLDTEGKSHPSFLYFGAHTGRFSGKSSSGGSNVNMLNMPRKPVLSGDEHVFGGKGVDIRGMYIPRPGYKFVVFDYSQIEARFSLWLVDDTHMMDALKVEGNLYQANAVAMGWCESKSDIKHTDPDTYRLAKCCVLGLGYGMGAVKFVDSCKSQGLDLPSVCVDEWPEIDRRLNFVLRNVARIRGDLKSERNARKVGQVLKAMSVVDTWRRANQAIVDRWRFYESTFKARVAAGKETVAFKLPSGRVKRYWDPCLAKEETIEVDENGREHPGFRIAMKATLVRGEAPKFLTGGTIMENIVQATCRDIMTYGCLEIEEKHPRWEFKFSVYDEVIFEVPEQECEEARIEIPRIMTSGDRIAEWTRGMPLEVEGDVVDRYCK